VTQQPLFTKYPATRRRMRRAPTLSGWWRRAFAALVDAIVLLAVFIFVVVRSGPEGPSPRALLGLLVGVALYYTLAHGGASGQTIGKRMLGIAVRRTDGRRTGYLRAFVRLIAAWTLGVVPGVSLVNGLRPLWNEMNRTYHDGIAKTIVVRVR